MKKKPPPVCEIENPEFWYGLSKILVKKKHPPVCEIKNPEFWYGCCKILVKKKHILKDWMLKKQTKVFSRFFNENISEFFFILSSAFTLIIIIITSPKNFGKMAILKI